MWRWRSNFQRNAAWVVFAEACLVRVRHFVAHRTLATALGFGRCRHCEDVCSLVCRAKALIHWRAFPHVRHCSNEFGTGLIGKKIFLRHISRRRTLMTRNRTIHFKILHLHNCISLRYDFYAGTRNIKLLTWGQIRKIRDCCIYNVNGCSVFL